jgi:protein involved in temperature-dependent protein secretion
MQSTWRRIRTRRKPAAPFGNLIALIRTRLSRQPADLRLRQSLATHLGLAGRYQEAVEEAERLVQMAPGRRSAKRLLLELKLNRLVHGSLHWR